MLAEDGLAAAKAQKLQQQTPETLNPGFDELNPVAIDAPTMTPLP